MADAQASGACGRKIVWVQVPSPAFFFCKITLDSNKLFQSKIPGFSDLFRIPGIFVLQSYLFVIFCFSLNLIHIHISDCFYKNSLCIFIIILLYIFQCQIDIIIYQIAAVIIYDVFI